MLRAYQGIAPRIHSSCYIDDSAQIVGDVEIGENSSVWMNAVIRGDVFAIRIGKNSNVQDCSVLHGMRYKYGVIMAISSPWATPSPFTMHHRRPLPDRHGFGHSEQREDRRRQHYRRRNGGSRRHGGRTVFSVDGCAGKIQKEDRDEDSQKSILMYANNYIDYTQMYRNEPGFKRT